MCKPPEDTEARENNPPMYQEAAVGFSEPGLVKEAREGKAEVVRQ